MMTTNSIQKLFFLMAIFLLSLLLSRFLPLRVSATANEAIVSTTRVSVSSEGSQADSFSSYPAISARGRFVTFDSFSSNLVAEDTNSDVDVFVHDRQEGVTQLVSINSNGDQANSGSLEPVISADGHYVAFMSAADNLVVDDTNEEFDIFVHDRQTRQTERISIDSNGNQSVGYSAGPDIAAGDGRYVAFMSSAANLVPGDTNVMFDVFVHDREENVTERVSVSSNGDQGNNHASLPAISDDGQIVAYLSLADNLVSGDTNDKADIFVYDRKEKTTQRVSVTSNGVQSSGGSLEPAISGDGQIVAFSSNAGDLVEGDTNEKRDVFIHDRNTGQTAIVSLDSNGVQANDDSSEPAVSLDGRYVVYTSLASNLILNDTNEEADIFLHDRQTGETERVSIDSTGAQADHGSFIADISADGSTLAFMSFATNLVEDDTNNEADIFVSELQASGGKLFLPVVKRK